VNSHTLSLFMLIYSVQKVGYAMFLISSRCNCLLLALWPNQLLIQWVPEALNPRVKLLGHETDHPPPSSAKVKNVWCYTSSPLYIFMAWCSVKHRDNFIFTFFTFYYYYP